MCNNAFGNHITKTRFLKLNITTVSRTGFSLECICEINRYHVTGFTLNNRFDGPWRTIALQAYERNADFHPKWLIQLAAE